MHLRRFHDIDRFAGIGILVAKVEGDAVFVTGLLVVVEGGLVETGIVCLIAFLGKLDILSPLELVFLVHAEVDLVGELDGQGLHGNRLRLGGIEGLPLLGIRLRLLIGGQGSRLVRIGARGERIKVLVVFRRAHVRRDGRNVAGVEYAGGHENRHAP